MPNSYTDLSLSSVDEIDDFYEMGEELEEFEELNNGSNTPNTFKSTIKEFSTFEGEMHSSAKTVVSMATEGCEMIISSVPESPFDTLTEAIKLWGGEDIWEGEVTASTEKHLLGQNQIRLANLAVGNYQEQFYNDLENGMGLGDRVIGATEIQTDIAEAVIAMGVTVAAFALGGVVGLVGVGAVETYLTVSSISRSVAIGAASAGFFNEFGLEFTGRSDNEYINSAAHGIQRAFGSEEEEVQYSRTDVNGGNVVGYEGTRDIRINGHVEDHLLSNGVISQVERHYYNAEGVEIGTRTFTYDNYKEMNPTVDVDHLKYSQKEVVEETINGGVIINNAERIIPVEVSSVVIDGENSHLTYSFMGNEVEEEINLSVNSYGDAEGYEVFHYTTNTGEIIYTEAIEHQTTKSPISLTSNVIGGMSFSIDEDATVHQAVFGSAMAGNAQMNLFERIDAMKRLNYMHNALNALHTVSQINSAVVSTIAAFDVSEDDSGAMFDIVKVAMDTPLASMKLAGADMQLKAANTMASVSVAMNVFMAASLGSFAAEKGIGKLTQGTAEGLKAGSELLDRFVESEEERISNFMRSMTRVLEREEAMSIENGLIDITKGAEESLAKTSLDAEVNNFNLLDNTIPEKPSHNVLHDLFSNESRFYDILESGLTGVERIEGEELGEKIAQGISNFAEQLGIATEEAGESITAQAEEKLMQHSLETGIEVGTEAGLTGELTKGAEELARVGIEVVEEKMAIISEEAAERLTQHSIEAGVEIGLAGGLAGGLVEGEILLAGEEIIGEKAVQLGEEAFEQIAQHGIEAGEGFLLDDAEEAGSKVLGEDGEGGNGSGSKTVDASFTITEDVERKTISSPMSFGELLLDETKRGAKRFGTVMLTQGALSVMSGNFEAQIINFLAREIDISEEMLFDSTYDALIKQTENALFNVPIVSGLFSGKTLAIMATSFSFGNITRAIEHNELRSVREVQKTMAYSFEKENFGAVMNDIKEKMEKHGVTIDLKDVENKGHVHVRTVDISSGYTNRSKTFVTSDLEGLEAKTAYVKQEIISSHIQEGLRSLQGKYEISRAFFADETTIRQELINDAKLAEKLGFAIEEEKVLVNGVEVSGEKLYSQLIDGLNSGEYKSFYKTTGMDEKSIDRFLSTDENFLKHVATNEYVSGRMGLLFDNELVAYKKDLIIDTFYDGEIEKYRAEPDAWKTHGGRGLTGMDADDVRLKTLNFIERDHGGISNAGTMKTHAKTESYYHDVMSAKADKGNEFNTAYSKIQSENLRMVSTNSTKNFWLSLATLSVFGSRDPITTDGRYALQTMRLAGHVHNNDVFSNIAHSVNTGAPMSVLSVPLALLGYDYGENWANDMVKSNFESIKDNVEFNSNYGFDAEFFKQDAENGINDEELFEISENLNNENGVGSNSNGIEKPDDDSNDNKDNTKGLTNHEHSDKHQED